eukprot:856720-Prorocentrum_minimum.AAC.1
MSAEMWGAAGGREGGDGVPSVLSRGARRAHPRKARVAPAGEPLPPRGGGRGGRGGGVGGAGGGGGGGVRSAADTDAPLHPRLPTPGARYFKLTGPVSGPHAAVFDARGQPGGPPVLPSGHPVSLTATLGNSSSVPLRLRPPRLRLVGPANCSLLWTSVGSMPPLDGCDGAADLPPGAAVTEMFELLPEGPPRDPSWGYLAAPISLGALDCVWERRAPLPADGGDSLTGEVNSPTEAEVSEVASALEE